MTGKALFGGFVGIVALATVSTAFGQADVFDSKLSASTFNTKLVQAFDECVTPTTIIGGIGGIGGCVPAHVDTAPDADTEQFSVGKLVVKSKFSKSQVIGILKSSGNANGKRQLAGKTLQVQLVLRLTKRTSGGASGHSPAQPVTWVDQTLLCPASTVSAKGNFLFKGDLTSSPPGGCGLDNDLNQRDYLKEVVAARIIDNTSGKIIAVPGVRNSKPGGS